MKVFSDKLELGVVKSLASRPIAAVQVGGFSLSNFTHVKTSVPAERRIVCGAGALYREREMSAARPLPSSCLVFPL